MNDKPLVILVLNYETFVAAATAQGYKVECSEWQTGASMTVYEGSTVIAYAVRDADSIETPLEAVASWMLNNGRLTPGDFV